MDTRETFDEWRITPSNEPTAPSQPKVIGVEHASIEVVMRQAAEIARRESQSVRVERWRKEREQTSLLLLRFHVNQTGGVVPSSEKP